MVFFLQIYMNFSDTLDTSVSILFNVSYLGTKGVNESFCQVLILGAFS